MANIWGRTRIKILLQVVDEFYILQIEEYNSDSNEATKDKENSKLKSKVADHDITQLSNNFIPKGLVPLEKLFDQNNVPKNPFSASPENDIEDTNIGTDEEIKNVKICASLTQNLNLNMSNFLRIINIYVPSLMLI